MRKALFVVVLAACAGGSKHAASGGAGHAPGTSCDELAAKAVTSAGERLSAEEGEHLRKIIVERCSTDNWGPEVRSCVASAGMHDDVHACVDRLTPEQREALDRDTATVRAKPKRGMDGGAAPTGSPLPGKDPCEGGE